MKENIHKGSSAFGNPMGLHNSNPSRDTLSGQRATIAKLCEESKIYYIIKPQSLENYFCLFQFHSLKYFRWQFNLLNEFSGASKDLAIVDIRRFRCPNPRCEGGSQSCSWRYAFSFIFYSILADKCMLFIPFQRSWRYYCCNVLHGHSASDLFPLSLHLLWIAVVLKFIVFANYLVLTWFY